MGMFRIGATALAVLVGAWACAESDEAAQGGTAAVGGASGAGRGGVGGAGGAGRGVGGGRPSGGATAICEYIIRVEDGGGSGTSNCVSCDGIPCVSGDACSVRQSRCDCVDGAFSCSFGQGGTNAATDGGTRDAG